MNLLFIQGGSRLKCDTDGNLYTDSNFNESIWNRYQKYCDELTIILRKEEKIYSVKEATKKFNILCGKKVKCCALPDVYRPIKNAVSIKKRKEISKVIENEVKKADKIIIRSLGNVYTNTALKYVRKYNKQYLVEVTGFIYEGLFYHSLKGKLIAFFKENKCKKLMKDVPYAVYVTEDALQKRYLCNGKTLGCSDVELTKFDDKILEKKISKLNNMDKSKKIVLGTAGSLDFNLKGQKYVIKAIFVLKKLGYDNFEYQLIGAGNGEKLNKLIKKLKLESKVKIIGTIPHQDVFNWLDNIDIYVQPSLYEGLSRSIIEAMSRACPVICTNVGGNYELINSKYMFKKGNVNQLVNILSNLNKENLIEQSKKNYKKSKNFSAEILNKKRNNFYLNFINERGNE